MNVSEALIREIVTKVLEESAGKGGKPEFESTSIPADHRHQDQHRQVRALPAGRRQAQGRGDAGGGPPHGCGIMELDHTSFEWTLTYDEYDLVLDGTLEIEIDGRVVSGGPGDIIYIPKGSHIHFQTPNRTRYAYFVYPADWQ